MLVSELIDILRDQPGDAEVEIAVVAPVGDDDGDICGAGRGAGAVHDGAAGDDEVVHVSSRRRGSRS